MATAPEIQYRNPDGTIFEPYRAGVGKSKELVTGDKLGLEPILNYYDPQNVGFFSLETKRTGPFKATETEYVWNPSKYDFSGLQLLRAPGGMGRGDKATYVNEDGIRLDYQPSTDTFTTPYDPNTLRDYKQNNPSAYNTILANNITEDIFGNWAANKNQDNQPLYDRLESIKEKSPDAYYTAKINLLSKQAGWNHGQNTFERAAPLLQEIEKLAPEAVKAGVSPDAIGSIYSSGFSEASSSNQNRIAREAANPSGFSLSELVRGVAPVAALAIGAPFLDAALAGSAAATTAGSAGAAGTTGVAAPGFVGLTPGFATELGLVGGSGLSGAGAAGNVLAGIYGAGAAPGFVGLTPEFATELGLSGGSGLSTAGASGNVLAGIYGAGEGAAFGMSDELAAELGLSGGSGLDTAGAAGDPLAGIYGASKPLITPGQALQAARLGTGLLSGGQQQPQQQAQQQMMRQNVMPRGAVDYSGIYNLLSLQTPRNPYSLLG